MTMLRRTAPSEEKMKKIAVLSVAAALLAGPALAQTYYDGPVRSARYGAPYAAQHPDHITTGSIIPAPGPDIAPPQERFSLNPAADGNANMQTRQAPNFGTVSGGYEAAE
jgi:hypothetical protein